MNTRDRRRSDRQDVALPNDAFRVAPSDDERIARRAFELYCDRGGQDGYDVEDWLQAERELRPMDAPAQATALAMGQLEVELARQADRENK